MIFTSDLREDYQFVKRAIEHTDNKLVHYPSLKNLITIFASKWKDKISTAENSAYQFSLHSLKLLLKRSFR
jgi:hypothetical protein